MSLRFVPGAGRAICRALFPKQDVSLYRVWVAVPIEVEAADEMNAADAAVRFVAEDLNPTKQWAKKLHAIDSMTEIKVGRTWRPV